MSQQSSRRDIDQIMSMSLFLWKKQADQKYAKYRRAACFNRLTKGEHSCSQGGASFNCINFVVAMNLCACGYYPNNGAPDCQRF